MPLVISAGVLGVELLLELFFALENPLRVVCTDLDYIVISDNVLEVYVAQILWNRTLVEIRSLSLLEGFIVEEEVRHLHLASVEHTGLGRDKWVGGIEVWLASDLLLVDL